MKHDGGWRLDQPEAGRFRWISRLGHAYAVDPPPIVEPLPNPIPRNGPAPSLLIPIDVDLGMWDDGPPERDTGSPPGPPPPDPDDDPPPF